MKVSFFSISLNHNQLIIVGDLAYHVKAMRKKKENFTEETIM